MIIETGTFILKFLDGHFTGGRVLEVGSRDLTSPIPSARMLFKDKVNEYIGIDMLPGPGVDQVIDGHDIKIYFQEGEFDVVVSTDTLEHDRAFWKTVENMRWVLKPGGWMVIAVPTLHCGLHEHPKDYWRFMQEGVGEFFEGFEDCYLETFTIAGGDLAYPDELMAWGRKPL